MKKWKLYFIVSIFLGILLMVYYNQIILFIESYNIWLLALIPVTIILYVAGFFGKVFGAIATFKLRSKFIGKTDITQDQAKTIATNYLKDKFHGHIVAGSNYKVIADSGGETDFESPMYYFCLTTRKFSGTGKVILNDIPDRDKFFVFVSKKNAEVTFNPEINTIREANEFNDYKRDRALSFGLKKKPSELEDILKKSEAEAFGKKEGEERAVNK